jgi:type IV secretory pathway VirB3-like protein
MKNFRILTAPSLLKGIHMLGWILIAIVSLILFDVISITINTLIALVVTVPIAILLYVVIRSKSDANPDFIMIWFIRYSKIKKTINVSSFQGNCYGC